MTSGTKIRELRYFVYLKEVLWLALTSFGGPQVHLVRFEKRLVAKKKIITKNELIELNSLCQMLPGPSSTQTITSIGFKLGGPLLAFLTLLVWILPSVFLMTVLVVIYNYTGKELFPKKILQFIPEMAVGFIIFAAIKITKMMVKNKVDILIWSISILLSIIIHYPIVFPLILFIGGIVTNFTRKDKGKPERIKNMHWDNLLLFLGIFILAAILGAATHWKTILLFENTYRYGSMVFGGGNVLVPMMYDQFVLFKHYMDHEQFMTGVGLLQAFPGPVFSFATYAGGMAFHNSNSMMQIIGCGIGTVGIFLPGILLVFFIYPMWNQLKKYTPVIRAIEGINAASAGLVVTAGWLLVAPVLNSGNNLLLNISVILATIGLLFIPRLPQPVIVFLVLIAGYYI